MADFNKIIPIILRHEGGLTDDPADRGGITNYGISLTFAKDTKDKSLFDVDHDGDIDRNDIKKLTKEQAIQIYKKYFFDKAQLEKVNSNKIALNIMDAGVNHGVAKGISMAQQALNSIGYPEVKVDGKMGPVTLNALNSVNPEAFVEAYLRLRKNYYRRIVEVRPSQQKFLKGWNSRVESVRKESGKL